MASNTKLNHNISHKIAQACLHSVDYLREAKPKYIDYKIEPYVLQTRNPFESLFIPTDCYHSLKVIFELAGRIIVRLSLWFFVKIPTSYLDERLVLEELHFFTMLYPLLMVGCSQDNDKEWTPKCSFTRPNLLIFRDQRVEKFDVRHDTVYDEESLKAVLSTLARFHAASLALEVRSGEKLKEYVGEEKVFTDQGRVGQANRLAFETLRRLASERFSINDADILVPRIVKRANELVQADNDGCNVICHGNLYRTKIMFNDQTSPISCVLVNFKMIRYASLACDIVMLLFIHSTSAKKRDEMSDGLLQHYHTVLRETLLRAGLSEESTMIPTLERIKQEYEERKILGMVYAALSWPTTVYKQVVGGGDPAKLEDWYFRDRITWYKKAMDEDEDYERKMRQRITELLDEGRKLPSTIEP